MDRDLVESYIDTFSQSAQAITHSMGNIQKNVFKDSIITPDQFNMLHEIYSLDHCTSTELADRNKVKKSTITAIVNRLNEKGLIQRTQDETNRRSIILQLSEKGEKVLLEERKKMIDSLAPLGMNSSLDELKLITNSFQLLEKKLKTIEEGLNQNEE